MISVLHDPNLQSHYLWNLDKNETKTNQSDVVLVNLSVNIDFPTIRSASRSKPIMLE